MKTKILLSILTFPILAFGQLTNHFDNIDSKWNVAKTYPNGNMQNPFFVATRTTIFGFQGDTLINNELWFKLYSTDDSLFQSHLIFNGLSRTDNNRILFLDTLNQLDTLYDFNLNIGDSVFYNFGNFSEKLPIINIDSIQMNGQFYKRYRFAEPTGPNAFDYLGEIWIEGVGSIHGPIFPNHPRKFAQEIPDSLILICTNSNNQQFWQHPSYNSCYVNIVLSLNNKLESDLSIYPNPASSTLRIINSPDFATLTDLTGKTLLTIPTKHKETQIDISTFSNGIYFLKTNNGQTSKVVVQH